MANTFFRFKQFVVHQDRCAMKVTTDACICGAWTPVPGAVQKVLDIGAGTGLLSLMLAQRFAGIAIDAIEVDPVAAKQAGENFAASPWADRLSVIEGDVRQLALGNHYDLVVSNPPFFINSLLSGKSEKDRARHTLSLSYRDLVESVEKAAAPECMFAVLLPTEEIRQLTETAKTMGWQLHRQLLVKHTQGAAVKRVVSLFSKMPCTSICTSELNIKEESGLYTAAFRELLQSFYLEF